MRVQSVRLIGAALLASVLVLAAGSPHAQNAATPPVVPAPAPATPPAATPPAAPAVPAAPSAKAPNEEPGASQAPGISGDATMQTLDVPARPVALVRGSASWEDGFKTIHAAIDKIDVELGKAGLQPAGKPVANFVQVNESNFRFEAMVPITSKPDGKTELSSDVKLGMSPGGKALKFQHRGAYDDIESTYDLITAFLDEKGLKAQDFFIEEYLNDLKDAEDQNLEVDIYIFLQ